MTDHTFSLFEALNVVEAKKRWKTRKNRIYKRLLNRLMDDLLERQRTETLRNGPLLSAYERSTLYVRIDTYEDRTQVTVDAVHFSGADDTGPGGGKSNVRFLASFALARHGKVACLTQTGGEKIHEPNPGYTNTLSRIGARVRRMAGGGSCGAMPVAAKTENPTSGNGADLGENLGKIGNSLDFIVSMGARLLARSGTALPFRGSTTLKHPVRNLMRYLSNHCVDFGRLPDFCNRPDLIVVRIRSIRPAQPNRAESRLPSHGNSCDLHRVFSLWHAADQSGVRHDEARIEPYARRDGRSHPQ